MLLASAALLAVAVAGVMVVVTAAELRRAGAALYDVRRREVRYRAWVAERERFRQSRKAMRRIQDGVANAVQGALGGKLTPQDDAGSALPERPTPPEPPHD